MTQPAEDGVAVLSPTLQETLRSIGDTPIEAHPTIFETIHAELQSALTKLDEL